MKSKNPFTNKEIHESDRDRMKRKCRSGGNNMDIRALAKQLRKVKRRRRSRERNRRGKRRRGGGGGITTRRASVMYLQHCRI